MNKNITKLWVYTGVGLVLTATPLSAMANDIAFYADRAAVSTAGLRETVYGFMAFIAVAATFYRLLIGTNNPASNGVMARGASPVLLIGGIAVLGVLKDANLNLQGMLISLDQTFYQIGAQSMAGGF